MLFICCDAGMGAADQRNVMEHLRLNISFTHKYFMLKVTDMNNEEVALGITLLGEHQVLKRAC